MENNLESPVGSSPTIGALSLALAKAQSEISHAEKDATNPHFKSKYATLSSVLDACRGPLAKNELAVFQKIEGSPGSLKIVTILAHKSGEWMRSELPLVTSKNDMQGMGSAISYGRRYSLSAMVGVAQEDDDAEITVARKPDDKGVATKPVTSKPQDKTLDQLLVEAKKKSGWATHDLTNYVSAKFELPAGEKLDDKRKAQLIEIVSNKSPAMAFTELQMNSKKNPRNMVPARDLEREIIEGICIDREISEATLNTLIAAYGFKPHDMPMWVALEITEFLKVSTEDEVLARVFEMSTGGDDRG